MSSDTSDDQGGDLIDICILNNLAALIRFIDISLFFSHGRTAIDLGYFNISADLHVCERHILHELINNNLNDKCVYVCEFVVHSIHIDKKVIIYVTVYKNL